MKNLKSFFPSHDCLCKVDAELYSVNQDIITEEDINHLNLFLTPSSIIDGTNNELTPAILKHEHYRSFELPERELLRDKQGGVYFTKRLKGNGLYSCPFACWFHKRRNIMKDPTGLVLGLQCKDDYDKSFKNSKILREMGIETEIPMGAFILREIVFSIENEAKRMDIKKAFELAQLPSDYQNIEFVIRIDAIGVNHRMLDFFNADSLFSEDFCSKEVVQDLMLKETELLLNYEMKLLNTSITFDLENDLPSYLKFMTSRIMKNVAILHRNRGIHDQFTTQNLTLDGKYIDYDTLEWIPEKEDFEEKRISDMNKLTNSLTFFLKDILKEKKIAKGDDLTKTILEEGNATYSQHLHS